MMRAGLRLVLARDAACAKRIGPVFFEVFPMRNWLVLLVVGIAGPNPGGDGQSIVPENAKLEKLWSEGEFTEGPAYGPDGCIYFSDIGNRIMKFDPGTNKTTEYRNPSGRANGL